MELDHVLIAVSDLGAAGAEFESRYGLASVEGGRHPGWGTGNRIVPLGDAYLELVAVVAPAEAAGSSFGRWVERVAGSGPRPMGWAVRTSDLDGVADRLGLEPAAGSRVGRDGTPISWRTAGVEQAEAEPCFPFFIEWGPGTTLPGRAPIAHPAGAVRITELELGGDPERLSAWLGRASLPLAVRHGPPTVAGVTLTSDGGEIHLRSRAGG